MTDLIAILALLFSVWMGALHFDVSDIKREIREIKKIINKTETDGDD